jgi:transcriptional regulator NrdR family protein
MSVSRQVDLEEAIQARIGRGPRTCPSCGADDAGVVDSRRIGAAVRRRIKCQCGHSWRTRETIETDREVHTHAANISSDVIRLVQAMEKMVSAVRRLETEVYEKLPEPERNGGAE